MEDYCVAHNTIGSQEGSHWLSAEEYLREIQSAKVAGDSGARESGSFLEGRLCCAWLYVQTFLLGKSHWLSRPHCMYLLLMMVHMEPGIGGIDIKVD